MANDDRKEQKGEASMSDTQGGSGKAPNTDPVDRIYLDDAYNCITQMRQQNDALRKLVREMAQVIQVFSSDVHYRCTCSGCGTTGIACASCRHSREVRRIMDMAREVVGNGTHA